MYKNLSTVIEYLQIFYYFIHYREHTELPIIEWNKNAKNDRHLGKLKFSIATSRIEERNLKRSLAL